MQRRLDCIPKEIQQTGDQGYVLADVLEKKIPMHTFIAQLSDQDLACIVRGEGPSAQQPHGTGYEHSPSSVEWKKL